MQKGKEGQTLSQGVLQGRRTGPQTLPSEQTNSRGRNEDGDNCSLEAMETERREWCGCPRKPAPILHSVPLYFKKKTKSQGILAAFAFLPDLLSTQKTAFFSLLCPFIFLLLLRDCPLSHDTMTKKNAFLGLAFKVQSRLYAFILFLIAPCTERAQQGFVGLNYFPQIDGTPLPPGQQASPQQLFQMDGCA